LTNENVVSFIQFLSYLPLPKYVSHASARRTQYTIWLTEVKFANVRKGCNSIIRILIQTLPRQRTTATAQCSTPTCKTVLIIKPPVAVEESKKTHTLFKNCGDLACFVHKYGLLCLYYIRLHQHVCKFAFHTLQTPHRT
jgi:hypothetical protein